MQNNPSSYKKGKKRTKETKIDRYDLSNKIITEIGRRERERYIYIYIYIKVYIFID